MTTAKELSDAYDALKEANPKTKLALDLTPGVGVATAIADTVQDVYKGEYKDAALDALGAIPALVGLKSARKAVKLAKAAPKALAKGGRVTGYRGYGIARKV